MSAPLTPADLAAMRALPKSAGSIRLYAAKTALLAERDALAARVQRMEGALRSIAANTCCDRCQEAALVARAALAEPGA